MKVETKYLFRCDCGERLRMYSPNRITCPNCKEPMELNAVLKVYPGFGIGRISIRTYFKYGDVDKDDGIVV